MHGQNLCPIDIRKELYKKSLTRIIILSSILIILSAFFIFWGLKYFTERINAITAYLIFSVSVVLSFLLTGTTRAFLDRSWEGAVKQVNIKTVVDSTSVVKPSRETLYRKNVVVAKIELESGRTINRQLGVFIHSNENRDIVQVGDMVRHIKGCKYDQIINIKRKSTVTCVMCGIEASPDGGVCRNCGRSLVV